MERYLKCKLTKLLVGFWVLAGCDGSHGKGSSSDLDIVGGYVPDASHPASFSAVSLVKSDHSFCSGTVIAKNVVVTAGHCLADMKAADFSLAFGKGAEVVGKELRQPAQIFVHEQYKDGFNHPNYDVAFVVFDGGLPAGYTPIEVLTSAARLTKGQTVSPAGFGVTATKCMNGSCNAAPLTAVDMNFTEYVDTDNGQAKSLVMLDTPEKNHGICYGDSGGPVYAKVADRWYLVGSAIGFWDVLTSKVDYRNKRQCESGEALYTFLGDYVPWIEQKLGAPLMRSTDNGLEARPEKPVVPRPTAINDFGAWCAFNDQTAAADAAAWHSMHQLFVVPFDEPDAAGESSMDGAALLRCEPDQLQAFVSRIHKLAIDREDKITDFSPLAALASLNSLTIASLPEDIGTLLAAARELPSLTDLSLAGFAGDKPYDLRSLSQLTALTSLTISGSGATPILLPPGLKVKNLKLSGVVVDDSTGWAALGTMPNLTTLSFSNIKNLTGLEQVSVPALLELKITSGPADAALRVRKLVTLQRLTLRSSAITDVTPLAALTGLEEIDLIDNQITSLAPLAPLGKVRHLNARLNPVAGRVCPFGGDICALDAGTPNTFEQWCLFGQGLPADFSWNDGPLIQVVGHAVKALDSASGKDLDPATCRVIGDSVQHLDSLEISMVTVGLDVILLTDLRPLSSLTSLKNLVIEHAIQVTDVTPLAALTGLTKLSLKDMGGIDNSTLDATLSHLAGLEELTLQGSVATLQHVHDLPRLTKLDLFGATLFGVSLQSLEGIGGLPMLKDLSINYTNVADVTPLTAVGALEELAMANTKVRDISPLGLLPNLHFIYAPINLLTSSACPIAPFGNCYFGGSINPTLPPSRIPVVMGTFAFPGIKKTFRTQ